MAPALLSPGAPAGPDGVSTTPRTTQQAAKRSRRRMIDACLFLLATTMLLSAAATTYFIINSSPDVTVQSSGPKPSRSILSRLDISWLRDRYCDKFGNFTALQRFLAHSHAAPGVEDESIPVHRGGGAPHAPSGVTGGGGGGAAVATAAPHGVSNLRGSSDSDSLAVQLLGAQIQSRFTDMTCYLHGDETEICTYDHAICYDGSSVVLTVPVAPAASKADPAGRGEVLGDPTGACYDYRYYEPTALEFSNCKYDLYKFNRVPRGSIQPYPSITQPPKPSKLGKGETTAVCSVLGRFQRHDQFLCGILWPCR